VYSNCVRSRLIHGSETWLIKMEHEVKLCRTKTSMLRSKCRFTLKGRNRNAKIRELSALEPVSLVIEKNRLIWFERVECKDDHDWVKLYDSGG